VWLRDYVSVPVDRDCFAQEGQRRLFAWKMESVRSVVARESRATMGMLVFTIPRAERKGCMRHYTVNWCISIEESQNSYMVTLKFL